MAIRIFRTEVAGAVRVGVECDSDAEFDAFLGTRGIVLVDAPAADAKVIEPRSVVNVVEPRSAGRPSRDAEIAAAIDELGDELDLCTSINAQARAVRDYLAGQRFDEAPPGLSTIEAFLPGLLTCWAIFEPVET